MAQRFVQVFPDMNVVIIDFHHFQVIWVSPRIGERFIFGFAGKGTVDELSLDIEIICAWLENKEPDRVLRRVQWLIKNGPVCAHCGRL